jgi:hypothetical protein
MAAMGEKTSGVVHGDEGVKEPGRKVMFELSKAV